MCLTHGSRKNWISKSSNRLDVVKEGNRRTQKVHPDLLRKDEIQCELSKWRISSHALHSYNEDVELHTGPHGVKSLSRSVRSENADVLFALFDTVGAKTAYRLSHYGEPQVRRCSCRLFSIVKKNHGNNGIEQAIRRTEDIEPPLYATQRNLSLETDKNKSEKNN